MLLAPSRASAVLPEPRWSHAQSILGLGSAFWGAGAVGHLPPGLQELWAPRETLRDSARRSPSRNLGAGRQSVAKRPARILSLLPHSSPTSARDIRRRPWRAILRALVPLFVETNPQHPRSHILLLQPPSKKPKRLQAAKNGTRGRGDARRELRRGSPLPLGALGAERGAGAEPSAPH